jgi:DNA-binding NtrC family response regulator
MLFFIHFLFIFFSNRDDFLPKPINLDSLVESLENAYIKITNEAELSKNRPNLSQRFYEESAVVRLEGVTVSESEKKKVV